MEQSKIIICRTFDSFIEANIIKAKLDAYGIPCFLSGENLTYLTTSLLSGGIDLHIFEQDKERVADLLLNELQNLNTEDLISCPNCRSKRILDISKNQPGPAKVVKIILQLSKTHYCLNCDTEFDN